VDTQRSVDQSGRRRWARRDFLRIGVAGAAAAGTGLATGGRRAGAATKLEGPVNWFSASTIYTDPEAMAAWERATGVKVVNTPFGPVDEMLTKLRSGAALFDVVLVPQQLVQPLAREGRIVPIDTGKLPNFTNVFPYFKESPFLNFDGKTWGGLVLFGANAIAYNRKRIPNVDSLASLFDEKYRGRIAMRDSAEDSVAVAALQLGYKQPYRLTDTQLDEAKKLLLKQKPLVRTYWRGIADLQAAFANEEVWIAWSQLAVVEPLRRAGLDMGWVWPKEGALGWFTANCVVATSTRRPAAEALIDYVMGDDWGLAIARKFGYASCSDSVYRKMTPELIKRVDVDPAKLQSTPFKEEFDRPKWQRVWDEVKA
jgi:spermidine/putrescine-binding protein